MNTVRRGQNLSFTAIWHGRGNLSKSSGFMINSKRNRHQICIDGPYLNGKINSKSADLPKKYHDSSYFFNNFMAAVFLPFKISPQKQKKSETLSPSIPRGTRYR